MQHVHEFFGDARQPAGKLSPLLSSEIETGPFSVGFETLDRDMFDPKRTHEHLARSGAKWARVQTGWCKCETTKGVYDFSWLDEIVDDLLAIGIQPWLSLGFGNRLYTPDAPHPSARGYVAFYYGDEAARAWVNYVHAIAAHFKGRVTHWEVWNEPNAKGFWQPQKPNPADYVKLVRTCSDAVRAEIPDAVMVGGVLSSVYSTMCIGYMEACFQLGLGDHLDVLSHHPYHKIPEREYASEVRCLRDIMAAHNPRMEYWQGENGCQSKRGGLCEFLDFESLDETTQARWLLRRLMADLKEGATLAQYFHAVDLFNYVQDSGPTGLNQYMGLLRGEDYAPKPAFFAFQNLCTLFDYQPRVARGMMLISKTKGRAYDPRFEEAAVIDTVFQRDGVPIFTYWLPTDTEFVLDPQSVNIAVWPGHGFELNDPVLIDPYTGEWFNLDARPGGWNAPLFENMPLCDYPLFITDKSYSDRLATGV
jgi:hypothetical protein